MVKVNPRALENNKKYNTLYICTIHGRIFKCGFKSSERDDMMKHFYDKHGTICCKEPTDDIILHYMRNHVRREITGKEL